MVQPSARPASVGRRKTAAAKKTSAKTAGKTSKTAVAKRAASPAKTAKKTSRTSRASTNVTAKKTTAPAKKAAAKKTTTAKKTPAAAATKKAPVKATTSSSKPAPKPALKKTPFDKKFLDAQKELLLEERATYTQQADALQAEADSLAAEREPGDVQFDEESGEGDTMAVERDFDLALSAQARANVDDIDLALDKIRKGTYGICEASGLAIPKERLKAIPWARVRVEYKVGGFS